MKLGFSGVIFDGFAGEHAKNIADAAEIVKVAHAFGATVEGEIRYVGKVPNMDNGASNMDTKISEAQDYFSATGVDVLAVSIGTAHGAYKSKPKLDFTRLRKYITQY